MKHRNVSDTDEAGIELFWVVRQISVSDKSMLCFISAVTGLQYAPAKMLEVRSQFLVEHRVGQKASDWSKLLVAHH